MEDNQRARRSALAYLYLMFLVFGVFLVWNGLLALKSGNSFPGPDIGGGILSGEGANQFSMGQIAFGAVLGLVSVIGLIGMLLKRGP